MSLRFSFWPNPAQPYAEVLSLATHIEQTGWDGLWYADHFMPNAEDTSEPMPEAWTTLASLVTQVPRIRMGTLVSGNTYRHPAILAKMAATLDHISAGRMVLGLGSGWQENEHRQYGIPFYSTAQRLARLEEACQVIKLLYCQEKSNFEGKYYQLQNASLEPKPLQTPLPLLIGGGGEKLTLKITAKYADEWNVWGNVATLVHKMKVLDQHCEAIGCDPSEIQRSAVALLFMSDDQTYLTHMHKAMSNSERPAIIGTPQQVREIAAEYEAAGVNELIIPDFTLGDHQRKIQTLDQFIEQVAGR